MTKEAINKVHAEPSILTRLGLALINVSKAGLSFKVKTQTTTLSAHVHKRS